MPAVSYRLRERRGEDGLLAKVRDSAQAEGRAKRLARRAARRKATPLPPESDMFGLRR